MAQKTLVALSPGYAAAGAAAESARVGHNDMRVFDRGREPFMFALFMLPCDPACACATDLFAAPQHTSTGMGGSEA